jgi:hypothetical protein
MSWCNFRRAVICICSKSKGIPAKISISIHPASRLCLNMVNIPFSRLVRRSGNRYCSEPLDKIYGMLGIASPETVSIIRVDYTLPVSKVYKDTFLEYTRLTQRLELLEGCDEPARLAGCPSWVPNWSIPTGRVWSFIQHASGHQCCE